MEVIPTLVIRNGRLSMRIAGDDGVGVFGADPVETALALVAEGAQALHVVDGDGQSSGRARNRVSIGAVVGAVDVNVMVQAGVTDRDGAEVLFDTGAAHVVVGAGAASTPGTIERLAEDFPDQVVLELSALAEPEITQGLLERFADVSLGAVLFDESRAVDTTFLERLPRLVQSSPWPVIAQARADRLEQLTTISEWAPGLMALTVGEPFYRGTFSVDEARRAVRPPR